MRAGCIIVTGTDLTQTSASGSLKSELDLMHAYSERASVYTLIRNSWTVRKHRTIIGPRLGFEPQTSRIESRRVATAPLTALFWQKVMRYILLSNAGALYFALLACALFFKPAFK